MLRSVLCLPLDKEGTRFACAAKKSISFARAEGARSPFSYQKGALCYSLFVIIEIVL